MNKWVIGIVVVAGISWWSSKDEAAPSQDAEPPQARLAHAVSVHVDSNQVKAKLHKVKTALYMYNAESGEVPVGFDEVVSFGMLRWEDVRDPWGKQFAFRSEKKAVSTIAFTEEYEIFVYSSGPDGIKDNGDDIYI